MKHVCIALFLTLTVSLTHAADHLIVCVDSPLVPAADCKAGCLFTDADGTAKAWGSSDDLCPATQLIMCMFNWGTRKREQYLYWPNCTIDGSHQPIAAMNIGGTVATGAGLPAPGWPGRKP